MSIENSFPPVSPRNKALKFRTSMITVLKNQDMDITWIDPNFMFKLMELVDSVPFKLHVSPAKGSIARTSGSKKSTHYVEDKNPKIQSKAIDIFPEASVYVVAKIAENLGFTGIGIYFDTKYRFLRKELGQPKGSIQPMIHLDTRNAGIPVIWCRENKHYYYAPSRGYYKAMARNAKLLQSPKGYI